MSAWKKCDSEEEGFLHLLLHMDVNGIHHILWVWIEICVLNILGCLTLVSLLFQSHVLIFTLFCCTIMECNYKSLSNILCTFQYFMTLKSFKWSIRVQAYRGVPRVASTGNRSGVQWSCTLLAAELTKLSCDNHECSFMRSAHLWAKLQGWDTL